MNEVTISGDISKSLNWVEQNAPKFFKAALYSGAAVIKNQAKANLTSQLPAATNHNPKYSDTLVDAIRNTKTEGDEITIHTLGTRESTSGTYRTRFFENGTKSGTRYQKTYRGVPLKKKKYVGRLPALRFFNSAVTSSEGRAIAAMQKVIDNMMDIAGKIE